MEIKLEEFEKSLKDVLYKQTFEFNGKQITLQEWAKENPLLALASISSALKITKRLLPDVKKTK